MKKHDFIKDEDGSVDVFQVDSGFHNGPRCTRCGESFCHHCYPEKMNENCPESNLKD